MPKLDRIPLFDERSRNYGIRSILSSDRVTRRKRVWRTRPLPLDQGAEGACVGFAWSGELAATPMQYTVTDATARDLYEAARMQDQEMGHHWEEGASVLAGARAAQAQGYVRRYHWAFGLGQVIDTIIAKGPVVLGINWYDGMYYTDGDLCTVSGSVVGGHAILCNGYLPSHPAYGEVLVLTNSWGPSWGSNGAAYIPAAHVDRLLREDGEACVPTDTRAGA